MNLAVEARTVYSRELRGIGKTLIDLYARVAATRPGWRFVIFHQKEAEDDPFAGIGNVEHRRIEMPGDRWNLWQQVRLPVAAKMAGADVLHCPANTAPRWPLVPMVVTIHDLIPLEPDSGHTAPKAWGRNVARAARKARHIITPSEFSKRQIVETFGIRPEKITVNYWAPAEKCRQITDNAELAAARGRYGLHKDRPYVLGFGAADPRKNTAHVLQAWAALPERLRKEHQLLLVGIQDVAMRRFRDMATGLGLDGQCMLHGFAADDDLPALLSGAEFLCYPSISEGFGLPVLDAFKCGTAVLTSNRTSLPEVAGDAAVLVDPSSVESIAGGVSSLLSDEGLREAMVKRGLKRVESFTWEACANRVIGVFEKVMEQAQ